MTPKEKARELFNKYCYAIRTEETDSGYFTNVIYAKQCAVIAVDEMIIYSDSCYYEWLNEVKQEIEKL